MNLNLLAELPMLNSVSNLSDGNTADEENNLKLVFEPIVNKIIGELETIQK